MGLLRGIKTELYKVLFSKGFVICVLVTVLLCLTSGAYNDALTNRTYSVWETLTLLDRELLMTDSSMINVLVFSQGLGGYLGLFLPIVSAFPFIRVFCIERKTGFMRCEILRIGRTPYYCSRFLAGLISGGCVTLSGYILFGMIVCIGFPEMSVYHMDALLIEWLGLDHIPEMVFACLANAFFYGAVSASLSLLLCTFLYNEYMILCIPFMITYIGEVLLNKLLSGKSISYTLYTILRPFSMAYMFLDSCWKWMLLFHGGCLFITFIVFYFVMKGRLDQSV